MNRVLWYMGRRRPLLLIGMPGMLLLAAGLAVGALVVHVVLQRHVTPVGTATISVFLTIGGAMAVYASLILNTIGKLETTVQGAGAVKGGSEVSREATASPSPVWPLLFLGIPGMLGLLAGLAWGTWAVGAFLRGRGLLHGSFIGSSALCVGSLMTWLTGIVLHALYEVWAGAIKGAATQEPQVNG